MLWILIIGILPQFTSVIYDTNRHMYFPYINFDNISLKKQALQKELLNKRGINPEIHDVITEDGYILTLFRVPGSRTPPIVVMPGFLITSDSFVIGPRNESIVNAMTEEGYDLWLCNYRGGKYGIRHSYLDPNQNPARFWNYTFHEIATRDVPAIIDYIGNVTENSQVLYMAHSMGALVYYVLCSERPDYCTRIKSSVLLAPVVFPPAKLRRFYLPLLTKMVKTFASAAKAMGIYHLFKDDLTTQEFLYNFCKLPGFGNMCTLGVQTKGLVEQDIPSYVANGMSDTSIKLAEHLCQLMDGSHRVPKYQDSSPASILYFWSKNKALIYNGTIQAPVIMFHSEVDPFIDDQALRDFRKVATNIELDVTIGDPAYDHMNFLYGKKTKEYVTDYVCEWLRKM